MNRVTRKDVRKLVDHWRTSSQNDWRIFQKLKRSRDYPQALFFLHLCLEKWIKALIVKKTSEHAPFSHNLVLLFGRANLSPTQELLDDLEKISRFNIEGRYPEDLLKIKLSTSLAEVKKWEKRAKNILQFLDRQF